MSNEESKAANGERSSGNGERSARSGEAPEQQDAINPLAVGDQAMWIDATNLPNIVSLTIPDATTSQPVTITTVPSDVLAANVAAMNTYALSMGVLVNQGPPV
jgi:hypothetical protein